MSDSENDTGEIKLQNTVLITDYVDSDESDDSEIFEPTDMQRTRLKSIDEETEENSDVLSELLAEIATVEPIGKDVIKIELFDKKKKFLKPTEDVEFDTNEHGYPFIPAECEEYLLPFLQKMKTIRPELKKTKIETNVSKLSFKF